MSRCGALTTLVSLALLSLGPGCPSTKYAHVICKVDSNPPSAEVWVRTLKSDEEAEAEQRDSTPCDLLFNRPGEYEVLVKKSGYQTVKKRVTVIEEAGTEGSEPSLKPLPPLMTVTLDPLEGDGASGDSGGKKSEGKSSDGGKKTDKPYYE